ncbi:hypothetical protein [Streptomyces sp. H34-S4]|uniref:hypothetical protein n=1 Tax=Streptomyces sp. H34-S4 TaxID=2996463 RepID=UPI00227092D2|nr:hypothetical protein [Streptomyces sp. H34-S4]MCY0932743.1 hypothetical protein [Streptomyces sp. H34-S4]
MAIGAVGALAGAFAHPVSHAVSVVFSAGWSWACFALLVGYFQRSKVWAALSASSASAVGVTVYYLLKALSPVDPIGQDFAAGPSGGNVLSGIIVWGIAAVVFCAPLGLFGNLARTPGIAGLPFRLLVPLIAYLETSWRLDIEAAAAGPAVAFTWSTIRALAVLAAVVLVGHTAWRWRTRHNSAEVSAASE